MLKHARALLAGKAASHCAIYTRKSAEQGHVQAFNSLDARSQACEAAIRSQRQEG